MFKTLDKMHAMLDRPPDTLKEISFLQMYGRDLQEAQRWCDMYKVNKYRTKYFKRKEVLNIPASITIFALLFLGNRRRSIFKRSMGHLFARSPPNRGAVPVADVT